MNTVLAKNSIVLPHCANVGWKTKPLSISCYAAQTLNVPRGVLIQNVLKILEKNDIPCPTDDEILCKILLYGHKSLPDNANSSILADTINYINKTKRFTILEAFVGLEVPS